MENRNIHRGALGVLLGAAVALSALAIPAVAEAHGGPCEKWKIHGRERNHNRNCDAPLQTVWSPSGWETIAPNAC